MIILITGCTHKKQISNIDNLPYYKEEYKERYENYQKNNQNLSKENVITRVNIGLDHPYYTNTKKTKYLNEIYILINKYLYMPNDYVPNNLEEINSKYTNGTKKLVREAKTKFEEMAETANKEGYTIRAISAFRSYEYQKGLYDNYAEKDGYQIADTYSARPGYSEHQTGLVVDIDNGVIDYNNFENAKEFSWMQKNAYKYGFILRYPKGKEDITGYTYESWHYRYVGEKIARYIKENNITFDEYYVRFIDK